MTRIGNFSAGDLSMILFKTTQLNLIYHALSNDVIFILAPHEVKNLTQMICNEFYTSDDT